MRRRRRHWLQALGASSRTRFLADSFRMLSPVIRNLIETLMPMFFNDEELLAGYAGEFVVPLDRARWTFSWFGGRAERSLSLRFGEPEAEARSIPETEAFVWAAQQCLAASGKRL